MMTFISFIGYLYIIFSTIFTTLMIAAAIGKMFSTGSENKESKDKNEKTKPQS